MLVNIENYLLVYHSLEPLVHTWWWYYEWYRCFSVWS